MKRFTEPLCWTVGFLVLFVWVMVATEVKEDAGYKIAAKASAEVAQKHAVEEPAATEEKHAVAEKKPAAVEKKHAAVEKKPAAAEKKHAAVEKKPAAAEKKPAAVEKKPAAAEKKPVAAEKKPAAAGGGEVADVIEMNNSAYKKHKKGICVFTHKKHTEEYEISCGDCHHDKDGKPLKSLKMGDDVQNCIECHKIGGKAKAPKGEKWSKEKKREYHADAVHDSCIPCHKRHNKENKTKAAPASCKGCHPKTKK